MVLINSLLMRKTTAFLIRIFNQKFFHHNERYSQTRQIKLKCHPNKWDSFLSSGSENILIDVSKLLKYSKQNSGVTFQMNDSGVDTFCFYIFVSMIDWTKYPFADTKTNFVAVYRGIRMTVCDTNQEIIYLRSRVSIIFWTIIL